MSLAEKLFASRLIICVSILVILLVSYALFVAYSNEIQDEVVRVLNDSFGHLDGELAKL